MLCLTDAAGGDDGLPERRVQPQRRGRRLCRLGLWCVLVLRCHVPRQIGHAVWLVSARAIGNELAACGLLVLMKGALQIAVRAIRDWASHPGSLVGWRVCGLGADADADSVEEATALVRKPAQRVPVLFVDHRFARRRTTRCSRARGCRASVSTSAPRPANRQSRCARGRVRRLLSLMSSVARFACDDPSLLRRLLGILAW